MTHRLSNAILPLLALASAAHAQSTRATIPGIAFTIDSGPTAPPPPPVVKQFGLPPELVTQFTGTVIFAGGRGRLDVAAVAHRTPAIRTEGIVMAAPLAMAGDYY